MMKLPIDKWCFLGFLLLFLFPLPSLAVDDIDSSPNIVEASFNIKIEETTGAFRYSYPLTLPPGRNGLAPIISLNYNSANRANDNVVGLGWTLAVPYIERKNLHGSDNLYSRHDFVSSLSGELEDITLTDDTHGTFGAKIDDGSFLSYEYVSDESWTMTDKKGLTYTFGSSSTSQIVDPDDATHVFRWLLDEVIDLNGNTVTYSYTKDGEQVYLTQINYTGHDREVGIYDLVFTYENRDDVFTAYASGFSVQTAQRLQKIEVMVSGELARKYELAYESGDNSVRSLLASIAETGYDQDSTSLSKPPTTFDYSEATRSWTQDTTYTDMPLEIAGSGVGSMGVYLFDINGDGFVDIAQGRGGTRAVYLNNGDNTWTEEATISLPVDFANGAGRDNSVRVFDLNGDGFEDILRSQLDSPSEVYINNGDGTGWTQDTTISVPIAFTIYGNDGGVRIFDVNGDGFQDIVSSRYGYSSQVYVNDGDSTGWTLNTDYSVPITFSNESGFDKGAKFFDANGDGLVDLIASAYDSSGVIDNAVYINNGNGTGWTEDLDFIVPIAFVNSARRDLGVRPMDFNGDGLIDLIYSLSDGSIDCGVYINNGDGTGWTLDSTAVVPTFFTSASGMDYGVRQVDVNNNGLEDIVRSQDLGPSTVHELYLADGGLSDQLSEIENDRGGITTITYEATNEQGGQIFFPLSTVASVTTNDGLGNLSTTTYEYYDGDYYYASEVDRDFAGFGYIETTNGLGEMTRSYYHQGNETESTLGESTDDRSKLWHAYREEVYDSSGHLYRTIIHSWENEDLGHDRDFVYESQTLELLYDADSDHTDKATEFVFDSTTGNLTSKTEYGEVTGADDGTFSDLSASDNLISEYSFAEFTDGAFSAYPSTEEVSDSGGGRLGFTAWLYDNLTPGQVVQGNLTSESRWLAPAVFANTFYSYNGYGFRTSMTDPLGHLTSFTPETWEMLVATETNALGQTISYEYDYSSGQVTEKTEQNGYVFTMAFDAFDRPVLSEQPDPETPTILETKTVWTYDDSARPTVVHQTDYFDATTTGETFVYTDGLGRTVQTRQENPDGFLVSDIIYDELGRKEIVSLPYQTSGEAYTDPIIEAALLETITYDALGRVVSDENIEGAATTAYEAGVTTESDRNGNNKAFYYDAFGHLVRVNERPGTSNYLTVYVWDGLGRLTKITDANGNIRRFTYDGLGRRLTAEDLHAPTDTEFGTWTYVFDAVGNLTSSFSPNGITTSYTYDDLNRVLTEDASSATGTEITYNYDTCVNGLGRLCSAAINGGATTEYEYDALGRVSQETKTLDSTAYLTAYKYDHQGNLSAIVYPDESQTNYFLNNAGQVETVEFVDAQTSETTTIANDIVYAPTGKVSSLTYNNGVVTTYTFDETDLYRLEATTTVSGTANIEDYIYDYDAVGNLTNLLDHSTLLTAPMNLTYTYDRLYRLTRAVSSSTEPSLAYNKTWTYGPTGNILSSSDLGTYNYQGTQPGNYANPHAVTRVAGQTLVYDKNGNQLSDGLWLNTWNWKNQLSKSKQGTTNVFYTYDHNGNRVTQTSTSGQALIYPNDYYTLDDTDEKRHILLPNFGSLATSTYDPTTTTSDIVYHHRDHLGGTHVETDATGAAIEYIVYNPYGSTLLDSQTTAYENNLKYTGKEQDEDTGWYYYGARYYLSERGRFLSEDPIFLSIGTDVKKLNSLLTTPQKLNSYSYTENNPVNNIDLTGESSFWAWALNPIGTAAQVGFWSRGSNFLSGSRPASAAFMEHSLGISPSNLSVDSSNQSKYGNIVDQIKGSAEYQSVLSNTITETESAGLNQRHYDRGQISGIAFGLNQDLGTSLGKVDVSSLDLSRNEDGSWNSNMTMSDLYNYDFKGYDSGIKNFSFGALNNLAAISQVAGTISLYNIDIKIKDSIKN